MNEGLRVYRAKVSAGTISSPSRPTWFRVLGSGVEVQGSGDGVQCFRGRGSGCSVQGLGFRVQCSGVGVQGAVSRGWGSGLRCSGVGVTEVGVTEVPASLKKEKGTHTGKSRGSLLPTGSGAAGPSRTASPARSFCFSAASPEEASSAKPPNLFWVWDSRVRMLFKS